MQFPVARERPLKTRPSIESIVREAQPHLQKVERSYRGRADVTRGCHNSPFVGNPKPCFSQQLPAIQNRSSFVLRAILVRDSGGGNGNANSSSLSPRSRSTRFPLVLFAGCVYIMQYRLEPGHVNPSIRTKKEHIHIRLLDNAEKWMEAETQKENERSREARTGMTGQ
ncbi:uncharacterized protein LOC112493627 [Cephus cinctus]|uniref:Uncharacterized protein LOC112493627 n=1 Tax=Cephus cinctus TaxID=211228 RepID=A0AAJ7R6X9_CEPCN|nr:uncharacterized protein LOC112493627 [Cephus cinctus]